MTKKQKNLYDEWKRLEKVIDIHAYSLGPEGSYQEPNRIDPGDFKRVYSLRKRVWKELLPFLDAEEKFELRKHSSFSGE